MNAAYAEAISPTFQQRSSNSRSLSGPRYSLVKRFTASSVPRRASRFARCGERVGGRYPGRRRELGPTKRAELLAQAFAALAMRFADRVAQKPPAPVPLDYRTVDARA